MAEKEPDHIFKQLDSIIKDKKILPREYIEENWVGAYIVKRFLSFVSCETALLKDLIPYINGLDHSNITGSWEEYLYLFYSIPKIDNARYYYIKKIKENNKKDEKKIDFAAEALEISKREAKYLIDNNYLDLKNYG